MRTSTPGGVAARHAVGRRAARIGALPVVALAAGLTVSACGGGGSSSSGSTGTTQLSATRWASQVCGRITTWVNDLQTSTNNLQSSVTPTGGIQQAKTQLVNFLGGAVASTNTMITGVQAAGAPAVANGAAISQGLVAGLQSVQSAFVQAQTQAQQLPTDNATSFENQAQALSTSLENAGNQVKNSLNSLSQKYSSSALDAAFKNQAACQSLKK